MIQVTDRYGNVYEIQDFLKDYFDERQFNWAGLKQSDREHELGILEEFADEIIKRRQPNHE